MSDDRTRVPANAGDAERWNVRLYHNACGKVILSQGAGYTCDGACRVYWRRMTMAQFTQSEMAERFHKFMEADATLYTIVWRTDPDSKTRYSRTIPLSEVRPTDERFTL